MYLDRITDDELADVGLIIEGTSRMALEVMHLVQRYREKQVGGAELLEAIEAYRREKPFFFKADITDLSYFWQSKTLDIGVLEMQPEELKKNILKNFDLLVQQGFVEIKEGVMKLTRSGEKMVFSSNFLMETVKSDMDKLAKISDGLAAETQRRQAEKLAKVLSPAELREWLLSIQAKLQEEPKKALEELKTLNASLDGMAGSLPEPMQQKAREIDALTKSVVLDGKHLREELPRLLQKWEKQEIEINFYDNTLRTENEIIREAAKKAEKGAEAAAKAAEKGAEVVAAGVAETAAVGAAAPTAGLSLAVKVGYEILTSAIKEFKHQVLK